MWPYLDIKFLTNMKLNLLKQNWPKFYRRSILAKLLSTMLIVGSLASWSLFCPAWLTLAQAQNNLDLSVSPPTAYLSVKPGATLQHTVTLENNSNQRLEISAKLVDFKADGKTGRPILGDGSIFSQILQSKFNLDKPFILEPGQKLPLQIRLNINSSAAQKEYPMTILFTAKPAFNANFNSSGGQVSAVIGSNLILLISQANEDQGKITLDNLDYSRLVDSLGKIKLQLVAKNTGSNATSVEGRIIIKNLLNKTVAEYIIYPDMILAGSTRQARVLKNSLAEFNDQGQLKPEQQQTLQNNIIYKPGFLFGIYSIEIKLNDETSVVQIFAFPFSILLAGVVGLGIFLAYRKFSEPII